jgi:hypothetical protein
MRFTVDVALHRLRTRTATGRVERVVLRRTVSTVLPDTSEARVEELWTSAPAAHVQPLLAVVRGIGGSARRVVLGEPVAVPDLAPVTGPVVDELAELVDRTEGGGAVDRLLGFRGTVDVDGGTRTLAGGELVCPAPGLLSRPVRSAFRRVIAELGCTAAGEPGGDAQDGDGGEPDGGAAPEPPDVASALRTDLRAARTRDGQHALWRTVADARLGPPVEAAAGVDVPGPVFARWSRRTADGTSLVPPDGDRTDLDSAAVTFVEITVGGLRLGERTRQLNLVRHRLDARIDLQAVLRQDEVRAAFAAYAAAGGTDPGLREAAVGALRAAGAAGETDRRTDALGGASSGAVGWLGGTVVFADCRGIQVGNELRQYTTVTCTVAPTAHTAALLRDHPDLVESIVAYACRIDGTPRSEVQRRLHAAVCGSADEDLVGEVARTGGRVADAVEEAEQRRLRGERRRRPNPLLPPNLLVAREPDGAEPDGAQPDGAVPDHDERDIAAPDTVEPGEPAVHEPRVLGRPTFYPEIEPDPSRRNGRSFGH